MSTATPVAQHGTNARPLAAALAVIAAIILVAAMFLVLSRANVAGTTSDSQAGAPGAFDPAQHDRGWELTTDGSQAGAPGAFDPAQHDRGWELTTSASGAGTTVTVVDHSGGPGARRAE